jgi:hypothetical protein
LTGFERAVEIAERVECERSRVHALERAVPVREDVVVATHVRGGEVLAGHEAEFRPVLVPCARVLQGVGQAASGASLPPRIDKAALGQGGRLLFAVVERCGPFQIEVVVAEGPQRCVGAERDVLVVAAAVGRHHQAGR